MAYVSEEQRQRHAEIGKIVKDFLKENKISVNRLAEESNILANNISRSLSGKNRMPKKVVRVLVSKYGMEESIFIPWKDKPKEKIILPLPKEDIECIKFLAAKESKTLHQLITDTIYEKYNEKIQKLKSI